MFCNEDNETIPTTRGSPPEWPGTMTPWPMDDRNQPAGGVR